MREHLLTPPKGARKGRKRVGRGDAAGQGSYAGRGMKGHKSRSGHGTIQGFEGGQMRMIKGLPMKRGFTNVFKTEYALVPLDMLESFEAGDRVTPEVLRERGLLREKGKPVKVLADGELTKAVTVVAHKFSGAARAKIEAAGGSVEEL